MMPHPLKRVFRGRVCYTKYLRVPTKEARFYPYSYYLITKVLESISVSVVLDGTIAVRWSIG